MRYIQENCIVNVLREEYKEWYTLLSKEELRAIRKYSYNSYDKGKNRFFLRLNAMLRGELKVYKSDNLEYYAALISSALQKHTCKHNFICYRGIDVGLPEHAKVGDEISFGQFLSTSVIKSKALHRKYMFKIYVPSGTTGAYIEEISYFPKQREFLLDKNCVFRILLIHENVVELEVVL